MEKIDDTGIMGDVSLGNDSATEGEIEAARPKEQIESETDELDWDNSPHNPFNWPAWKKALQVVMLSSAGLLSQINRNVNNESRSNTTHDRIQRQQHSRPPASNTLRPGPRLRACNRRSVIRNHRSLPHLRSEHSSWRTVHYGRGLRAQYWRVELSEIHGGFMLGACFGCCTGDVVRDVHA
ncbi:hypothetical protein LB505_004001 [Fusarium chuoi]|nr:hypothetical protein LB505_004001 [Fusarium chuoi]